MRPLRQTIFLGFVALTFALARVPAMPVLPEPVPDPAIPGFAFPESEATLTRWISLMTRGEPNTAAAAFERIHLHGWGLWTALTTETAQKYDGQNLRVFETWLTLDDLQNPAPSMLTLPLETPVRRVSPRQLTQLRLSEDAQGAAAIDRLLGFVKFDPTAADHIARQQLLQTGALNALLEGGATQIPPFPATALAIKPLFQIVRMRDLAAGRYYPLKAWPGPPAASRPWAPANWPGSVWLDLADGGDGRGAVDPIALPDGSTRTPETTYPLSSLIHFRISAADAAALNDGKPAPLADAGDFAILVAMHVSGREIARWTWQTFWWSPTPDEPRAPSSTAIAGLRPPQLQGPARHYAMALAYTMMSPDQPYVGGGNSAPAVYAYNPWLEAKLAPADLPDSVPGPGPDGAVVANNIGIQTNCMSCHARANYNPNRRPTAPRLSGARYVDLGAAEFVGTLQTDFLWSLPRHAQ